MSYLGPDEHQKPAEFHQSNGIVDLDSNGSNLVAENGECRCEDCFPPYPLDPCRARPETMMLQNESFRRYPQDAQVINWQQQIIVVSPFFYPELISTGKANQHLAEAFVTEGHGVTVICSHPVYPSWHPTASDAQLAGIKIIRGGESIRYPEAMPLRRFVLEAWFAMYSVKRIWRLRNQADTVVSILPPSLFALLLHLVLPRHVRRVAVIHDLQGVLAAQEKSLVRRLIIRMIHAVESQAFRSQDLCIFFSTDMAAVAQRAYNLDPARTSVQYPFITLPYREPQLNDAPAQHLVNIFPPEKLHVVYSGALGYKQNSHQLVEFLHAAAQTHPEAQFHVLSGGPFFEELSVKYGQLPGSHVHFHPLVAEQDLAELYARSSIQIIPQAEGTESAALPSKLPNLLAAGIHLLAICGENCEVGRLIEQASTGTIVERWDQQLFMSRLEEALAIVRWESSSERRARVEPLLHLFSAANIVRLTVGDHDDPIHAAPTTETAIAESEVHG